MKFCSTGFRITFLLGLLFGLSAGCKTSELSPLANDRVSIVPLVVLSGGFMSCVRNDRGEFDPRLMGMTDSLNKTIALLKASGITRVDTAVSCFSGRLNDASETIFYVLSSEPNQIKSGARRVFYDAVQSFSGSSEGRLNVIVGHSYGGWSTMKQMMALSNSSNKTLLTTIDPISPESCRPGTILQNDAVGDPGYVGCQQAPADFTATDILAIKSRVLKWNNFYQTDYWRLHSSAIKDAHQNERREFAAQPRKAHTQISEDVAVWDSIRKGILEFAAPTSVAPVLTPTPSPSLSPTVIAPGMPPTAPDAAPDNDLYVNLVGSATGAEQELLVSGNPGVARVILCRGKKADCLASPSEDVKFSAEATIQIPMRRVFRGLNSLLIGDQTAYTLIGYTGENKLVSTRSLKFVKK